MFTEPKKKEACDIEVVVKTFLGLLPRVSLPKFPAIEIDSTEVFEGCPVTTE